MIANLLAATEIYLSNCSTYRRHPKAKTEWALVPSSQDLFIDVSMIWCEVATRFDGRALEKVLPIFFLLWLRRVCQLESIQSDFDKHFSTWCQWPPNYWSSLDTRRSPSVWFAFVKTCFASLYQCKHFWRGDRHFTGTAINHIQFCTQNDLIISLK